MREVFNLTERYGPVEPKVRAEIRQQLDIAQRLYDIRTERGLSQSEVAALVGSSEAVIGRIEDADYDVGKSQRLLDRITGALGQDVSTSLSPTGAATA